MTELRSLRVLVLCTVGTGLDSIAQILRNGFPIECIVGVDPKHANSEAISGYIDIADFAGKWNVPHCHVERYDLSGANDRELLRSLVFDLIFVAGWQRLIPDWLIAQATMGALGGHGSADGIQGGRGRSPQNWAILLGCKRFDLALFRITSGVDDGPVVAQRSFFYNETDDIAISYKKAALCMGEMMVEVMKNPESLYAAIPQQGDVFYYPQRKPEDGYVDWCLTQMEIWAHCRALTKPYPGLRARQGEAKIVIWDCVPFDDVVKHTPGTVDFVFEDACYLVTCSDGRVLVRDYSAQGWTPAVGARFELDRFTETMKTIIERFRSRDPNMKLALRLLSALGGE